MSIAAQGVRSRSAGLISAICKQLKSINFKPVTKVTVQFDPFGERAVHARDFLNYVSAPKIQSTNLFCALKTNIVCDRSPPTVTCDLATGDKVIFKLNHLDTLDVLTLFNKHISSLVPVEEPPETGKAKKKKKIKIKRKIPLRRQ